MAKVKRAVDHRYRDRTIASPPFRRRPLRPVTPDDPIDRVIAEENAERDDMERDSAFERIEDAIRTMERQGEWS